MSTVDLVCVLYVVGAFASLEMWMNDGTAGRKHCTVKVLLMALFWPISWLWRWVSLVLCFVVVILHSILEDDCDGEED